jgi:cytochrome P450 family 4
VTVIKQNVKYKYLNTSINSHFLGPKWRKHRKITTPAFHFQILEQFLDVFESSGNTLIKKLEKEVGKKSFDIYPFITLCTLDVICGE